MVRIGQRMREAPEAKDRVLALDKDFEKMFRVVKVENPRKYGPATYEFTHAGDTYVLSLEYADECSDERIWLSINNVDVANYKNGRFINSPKFSDIDLSPIFTTVVDKIRKEYQLKLENDRIAKIHNDAKIAAREAEMREMVLGVVSKFNKE